MLQVGASRLHINTNSHLKNVNAINVRKDDAERGIKISSDFLQSAEYGRSVTEHFANGLAR